MLTPTRIPHRRTCFCRFNARPDPIMSVLVLLALAVVCFVAGALCEERTLAHMNREPACELPLPESTPGPLAGD